MRIDEITVGQLVQFEGVTLRVTEIDHEFETVTCSFGRPRCEDYLVCDPESLHPLHWKKY